MERRGRNITEGREERCMTKYMRRGGLIMLIKVIRDEVRAD